MVVVLLLAEGRVQDILGFGEDNHQIWRARPAGQ